MALWKRLQDQPQVKAAQRVRATNHMSISNASLCTITSSQIQKRATRMYECFQTFCDQNVHVSPDADFVAINVWLPGAPRTFCMTTSKTTTLDPLLENLMSTYASLLREPSVFYGAWVFWSLKPLSTLHPEYFSVPPAEPDRALLEQVHEVRADGSVVVECQSYAHLVRHGGAFYVRIYDARVSGTWAVALAAAQEVVDDAHAFDLCADS
ncbi:MAG: hypothetical protein EOO65_01405 [Methanosarcinales archaeon]|nr:MAG: hypothetical protein EOO65_01405 [Methanosarcinales archaeon]